MRQEEVLIIDQLFDIEETEIGRDRIADINIDLAGDQRRKAGFLILSRGLFEVHSIPLGKGFITVDAVVKSFAHADFEFLG